MDNDMNSGNGLHQGQPVFQVGAPLKQAQAVMLMIHGRGGSAKDILSLSTEWLQPGFTYMAPQAANFTWYPNSFLAPIAKNEPGLSSALTVIEQLVENLEKEGIPSERIILLGFSQGACLALEFAVRNARRYGGVAGLSGGLIGPDSTPRDYPGSLSGTPVILGCSDIDPHIPKERVLLSSEVFQRMGANVTTRIYPRMGHTINEEEIVLVNTMMKNLVEADAK